MGLSMVWSFDYANKNHSRTYVQCSNIDYGKGMFFPRDNPGYYTMGEQGKELIVRWVTNDENWYRTSSSSSSSNPTDPEVYMSGNDGE